MPVAAITHLIVGGADGDLLTVTLQLHGALLGLPHILQLSCLQGGQEQQAPKVCADGACIVHGLTLLSTLSALACVVCMHLACIRRASAHHVRDLQDLMMKTVGALTAAQLALLPLSGKETSISCWPPNRPCNYR
jgi:hypothetical protein